jgi:hypothetical protein
MLQRLATLISTVSSAAPGTGLPATIVPVMRPVVGGQRGLRLVLHLLY